MPSGGLANGDADLLDQDKECAGPQSDPMNLAGGPQVVGGQSQQKQKMPAPGKKRAMYYDAVNYKTLPGGRRNHW